MNDDQDLEHAPARWLELARGGGVLLRDPAEVRGNRPLKRSTRTRRSLGLTADAPWPVPSAASD
jgi:hypothetical protein